jgi:hypothetical protein
MTEGVRDDRATAELVQEAQWKGRSSDRNDERLGHVSETGGIDNCDDCDAVHVGGRCVANGTGRTGRRSIAHATAWVMGDA